MNKLQAFINSKKDQGSFITSADMPELLRLDRLCQLLVRCGGCRFVCAAQDVEHLIKCVEAGGDYCRDVSFPVGSLEAAARWQPEQEQQPVPVAVVQRRPATGRATVAPAVDGDYGGAFDGTRVISDADEGL